jgi:hypothetical protein
MIEQIPLPLYVSVRIHSIKQYIEIDGPNIGLANNNLDVGRVYPHILEIPYTD